MAGTMPHAIFVETGLDASGTVAAYAAELPGCAVFAASADEAAAAMPRRVAGFSAWLRAAGEGVAEFIGDNWYEVERVAAKPDRRAAFTLDELPPSPSEFAAYLRWLELAREALADAVDRVGESIAADRVEAITVQDLAFAAALGRPIRSPDGGPLDRCFAARDALTMTLEGAGPGADGARWILRIAIADDLRLADQLAGGPR